MRPLKFSAKLRGQVETLLRNGDSFFLLRMPRKAPKLVTKADGEIRVSLVGWRQSWRDAITIGNDNAASAPEFPAGTSRAAYMARVGYLIDRLKARGTAKTVISRVIAGSNPDTDWVSVAERFWNAYPDTFGYLLHTPSWGTWLGATPEKLLAGWYPAHFNTMALAGTLIGDEPLSVKVYEEQQMVERFMTDTLRPFSDNLAVSGPREYAFGHLRHLLTHFSGDASSPDAIPNILDSLSPTPALSGLPRELAYADIEETEDHARDLYGGYFLVKEGTSPGTDWAAFTACVIIRCMRFDPKTGQWAIYSGGGITDKSSAEEEWNETEEKASRLLSILQESSSIRN